MTIGKLAKAAGVGVETIRFYEREGLLEGPVRRASGYREYEKNVAARLFFIKAAQRLGFTLREVKELIALRLDRNAKRQSVREKALAKVADIESRIRELQSMKKTLTRLITACDGKGAVEGCPIISSIEASCPMMTGE